MATQGTPHICPECKTPQAGNSPFCESCGYRLRTQETALEGLPAITPEQLQRASVQRRVHTEEEPAITPEMARAHAQRQQPHQAPQRSSHAPSHTILEGLPAITPAQAPAPLDAHRETAHLPPAEVSALLPMAPPPRSTTSWLAPLAGGLMLGGILGTAFTWFASPDTSLREVNDDAVHTVHALKKLSFAPSTFTRGLDEPTRVRMLRLCYKVSDAADKECEQDTLMKDEYPQKQQQVSGFLLDSIEASNARYTQCVEAGACQPADLKACQVHTTQGLQISLRVPKILLEDTRPVICITHAQARAFCAWNKGRLPGHDEWELAARGSRDARLFPWGDSWDPTLANWGERDLTRTAVPGRIDGFAWTAPVGSFEEGSSPFGAHDMAGNVAEWVDHDATSSPQARGGSWISSPYDLRVTRRDTYAAGVARTDVGVRCAYD